jgi:hypothetical protein
MTALELVTQFCQETGLPVPGGLIGATEGHAVQMRALLQKVIMDLSQYNWQQQNRYVTWTSISGEDQGALKDIFGVDMDYLRLIPNTFWDNTEMRPVFGPVTEEVWAYYKAAVNPGPIYQYIIKQNRLLMSPNMVAGHTMSVQMYSNLKVVSSGGTLKQSFTADDDSFVFPDITVLRGLTWNWAKKKGEDWSDDHALYLDSIGKNLLNEGSPKLSMDAPQRGFSPGIVVPAGSWPV